MVKPTTILRRLLATAYYRGTGRGYILDAAQRFEDLYRCPRSEIDRISRARLTAILCHAAQYVPFYRKRLRSETITPANAASVLASMPILTKETIRREWANLVSELPGSRIRENTSGGSTGEPVRLLQDREMGEDNRTGELLFMRWAGHRLGEPHVLIWAVPKKTFSKRISLHERVFRYAHNETYFNCYQISDALLDQWIERLTCIRPVLIEAYVDALRELSRRILSTGKSVPPPRSIITSAGVLTEAGRSLIARAFRCPIYNRYGSREVGDIACSCSEGNELHVHECRAFVEIVNDDGAPCEIGVEGNILVTLLTNRTMPLIRYRIEDRGVWSEKECSCGRRTKRLAAVCGRTSDFLLAADGSKINGTALTTLLYDVRGIRRFQYRQASRERVTLEIAPLEHANQADLMKSLAVPAERLRHLLGGIQLDISFTDQILPSRSGKFRYIINEVTECKDKP